MLCPVPQVLGAVFPFPSVPIDKPSRVVYSSTHRSNELQQPRDPHMDIIDTHPDAWLTLALAEELEALGEPELAQALLSELA